MLVLVDHPVSPDVQASLNNRNVLHHPELLEQPAERGSVLCRKVPDVLLTRRALDPAEIAQWQENVCGRSLIVVLLDTIPDQRSSSAPRSRPSSAPVRVLRCPSTADGEIAHYDRALTMAERERLTVRFGPAVAARLSTVRAGSSSIAVVGAGVVNLVTGLRLLRSGHRVTFFDASPDPRNIEESPTAYGCSRGGADARMYTLTEADGYFGTRESGPVPFLRPLKDRGWCLADLSRLSDSEVSWTNSATEVPSWLARDLTEDVLGFNVEAGRLWQEWIERDPLLFEGVNLRERILRLYADSTVLDAHVRRQQALTGETCEPLTPVEVARRYPALAGAYRAGAFVGGLEVAGFTVQVHAFMRAIVDAAERAGADFHWGRTVDEVVRTPTRLVRRLRSGTETIEADHYVISPGAYGNALLRGTFADGMVHGVVGTWLTLPNLQPVLENSLKLSRPGHIAADANVTVTFGENGEPLLVVGSGYGWTGADPRNIDPAQLDVLYNAVDETAEAFFPEAFAEAKRTGLLNQSRRFCVRPWTASSLPVFEIDGTENGGLLIVTAGHNTGGFAQAPVIAEAVAAAIRGEEHSMHLRYHPNRFGSVMHQTRDEENLP